MTDDSNGSRDICRGAPHRSKVAATCCKIPKPGERDACYIPCTWNTYKKSWSSYIDGCSEKLAEFGEAPRDAANSEEANNTNTKAGSFNSIELDFKSTPAALAPRALPVATINNMEANLNVTETGFNAAAADLESRQYRGTWMHFCPGNLEMYCCNKPGYWAADGYDLVDTCKEGNAGTSIFPSPALLLSLVSFPHLTLPHSRVGCITAHRVRGCELPNLQRR